MNKKNLIPSLLLVVLCFSLFTVSCSKDDETPTAELTQNDVEASLEVEAISTFVDEMTMDNISPSKKALNCTGFSATQNGYTLSFDNCTINGETVNGSMTVSITIDNNVATSTVTFDNLSYGGNTISGTKTNSYAVDTAAGNFSYTVVSDISITLADGTTATENGTKTYTITGLGSAQAGYSITGDWNVTVGADAFSFATDPSISGTFDCAHITTGVLNITKNGQSASVDYGDGTCDNLATITLPDGTTVEVEL